MRTFGTRHVVGIILALLLAFSVGGAVGAENFNVSVVPLHFIINNVDKTPANGMFFNGQTNVPAGFILNGTTYVPLRFLSEELGATVKWDGSTNTITLNTGGTGTNSSDRPFKELPLWNSPNLSVQSPWQVDSSTGKIYLDKQNTSKTAYSFSYDLNRMASDVKGSLYLDTANSRLSDFGDYVTYTVLGDTNVLYSEDILGRYVGPVNFDVPVTGLSKLTIQVQIGPSSNVGFATTGVENLQALTRQY